MTYSFDIRRSLVVVPVSVSGPRGGEVFQFAVDTGASRTSISGLVLQTLGYSHSQTTGRQQVRTASGGLAVGSLPLQRFAAFGRTLTDFSILWMPHPPSALIDGLLGLDFFRQHVLMLDFMRGRVSLISRRKWWQFWS